MEVSNIKKREFEVKLLTLYPSLTEEQARNTIKQLFSFWWNIIENIDKFKK